MKALLVGAGPVGCLLAIGLRRRGHEVVVYDRGDDPRGACNPATARRNHSFNLTLSLRGLAALEPALRARLERNGVRLAERVIHQSDGQLLRQPYGIADEHQLLSIPRRLLHANLVEEAECSGAELRFRHECVRLDPVDGCAVFQLGGKTHQDAGDLLVGCDGANSVVRQELATRGVSVTSKQSGFGYLELDLPAVSGPPGFHLWPRGELLLIAQPNADGTGTTTLFGTLPALAQLRRGNAEIFFRGAFPDLEAESSSFAAQLQATPPAVLRTVRCHPWQMGRSLLIGDAAHTMLPFYGQGINSGFEDVRVLLRLLDDGRTDAFTSMRRGPCGAVAELSDLNFAELAGSAHPRFQARAAIERELYRRDPGRFVPLYCAIAFSEVPYDEALAQWERQRRRLDALCERHDVESESARIVESYLADEPVPRDELQLTPLQARELLDFTAARVLDHEAALTNGRYPPSFIHDSADVAGYTDGARLSEALRENEIPQRPAEISALLSEIFDRALASGTVHPHPGFMAHIPSGGLLQGAVGEFIARAVNRFAGVWIAAPGLIRLECNVLRWFCTLLGYGADAFGYLTTSGSLANMMGLLCAHEGDVVYASEQAHFSIVKAARLIGVSQFRTIPARRDYTMDVAALERAIDTDRAAGLRPRCVVATAGTTNTGAIDDLGAIAAVCETKRVFLHVDACFGGFFRTTARGRAALSGIEKADSIAVDAHKSLFLPHGLSALLVKHRSTLRAEFEIPGAAYMPGLSEDAELVDFCNYGPELSREVRGLAAWLPIKMHGIGAFERALDATIDLARELAAKLESIPALRVVRNHALVLPVVAFQAGGAEPHETLRLCARICSYGRVYVTTTTLPDHGVVIRACILNHRTGGVVVDQLVADVRRALDEEV